VWLAGPDTGSIPFRPESVPARVMMPFVGRVVFHRILTTGTPMGRRARPKMVRSGEPLIRVKKKDLQAAGIERVARVVGAEDGLPLLEDGRRIDAQNVVWATGFRPGFDFVDIPEMGGDGREPEHRRGVVEDVPGLFFLGLKFLYSVSSEQIHGVGRDAGYLAKQITRRSDG
jgi:putative flavoprotein involved in K+ transport